MMGVWVVELLWGASRCGSPPVRMRLWQQLAGLGSDKCACGYACSQQGWEVTAG
jgi:hypothetical protein